MIPRFIIGVRELYHHDSRRWRGIDTGFGVFSQPTAGESVVVPAIELMDVLPGDAADSEAIQLEVLGYNTHPVEGGLEADRRIWGPALSAE